MEKEFFIGFDIGTNSVGYAVTDTNYNILRARGQKLWGVRLFDEAETAKTRRTKRAARRLRERKKMQKEWLSEIFAPEIAKVDPLFLIRLKYSSLWEEDKKFMEETLEGKDSLFGPECVIDGKPYQDRDFHHDNKTSYHLRQKLLTQPAKDIRVLFLAVLNLLKSRGNFLYDGQVGNQSSIKDIAEKLKYALGEIEDKEAGRLFPFDVPEDIETKILEGLNAKKTKNDLKLDWKKLFGATAKNTKALIDCFVNGKLNLKAVFELEDKLEIDFSSDDVDSQIAEAEKVLDERELEVCFLVQEMFSNISLKKFLGKHRYVCEAMLEKYDDHEKQLKKFKAFIRKYYRDEKNENYNSIFRKEGLNNYPAYVGRSFINSKKYPITASCDAQTFYKFIKSFLDNKEKVCFTDENFETSKKEFLDLIEQGNFLPLQRSKENSVLPNKILEDELLKILNTSAEKFEFLNKKDKTGLTNIEKISQIFTFRVPYFVGPITNKTSENAWAKKISTEKLYPWTIEKIVDYNQCEDDFIKRMTNKCFYLPSEDVLPKHSLLYEKFMVLNELNNLKINGESISTELKQKIYTNLFMRQKRVTMRALREFLRSEKSLSEDEVKDLTFSGIDKEFKTSLTTYNTFALSSEFGAEWVAQNQQMIEDIVLWHTIISDKTRFAKRLQEGVYKGQLSEKQIKFIKGLNFKDWGRLSRKILSEFYFSDSKSGNKYTTVIQELWETNATLQQIYWADYYDLRKKLDEFSESKIEQFEYDALVKDLYCSVPVKRAVWQTLKIIKEVTNVLGNKPTKIFIETTRHDETKGEKGRKASRKDALLKLYENDQLKKMVQDYDELFGKLGQQDNLNLRSEKLYLYFLQLGRCAYSGEKIILEELLRDNSNYKYDVDHIIPQSYMVDDSLVNKVLVKKTYNEEKSNKYPLWRYFPQWVTTQKKFWKTLVDLKLMPSEKYARLTREEFNDTDRQQFVTRQLVETSQSALAVINILKRFVDKPADVVYSRAKHVSDFRKKYDILKSRTVNDFHHAQDAYLNIVVGNVLYHRYSGNRPDYYQDKENENAFKTSKAYSIFDKQVYESRAKNLVWNGEEDVKRIRETCLRHDMAISFMSYPNISDKFYKETVHKSSKNNPKTEAKFSLKANPANPLSNTERYGGYSDITTAYFMLIESDGKKNQRKTTLEAVPVIIYQKYKNSPNKNEEILAYLAKENALKNPKILMDRINMMSTLKIGNGEYLLSGKSGDALTLHNFNQWHADYEVIKYVRAIEKYLDLKDKKKTDGLVEENDKVVISKGKTSEVALIREENIKLFDILVKQTAKKIYQELQISSLSEDLINKKELFEEKNIFEQAKILYNLILRLARGSTNANLKVLNLSSTSGQLRVNKNITGKNIKLVLRSSAGLYEKVITL